MLTAETPEGHHVGQLGRSVEWPEHRAWVTEEPTDESWEEEAVGGRRQLRGILASREQFSRAIVRHLWLCI